MGTPCGDAMCCESQQLTFVDESMGGVDACEGRHAELRLSIGVEKQVLRGPGNGDHLGFWDHERLSEDVGAMLVEDTSAHKCRL